MNGDAGAADQIANAQALTRNGEGDVRRSRARGALARFAKIELLVDLTRRKQVFELLEPGEGAIVEDLLAHGNPLEDLTQLGGAALGGPATAESRKVAADLVEGDAIAAVVGAWRPICHDAAGEGRGDDLGNVADAVILLAAADIEYLIVHGLARRFERQQD